MSSRPRIIAFLDHEIGCRLLEKLIRSKTAFNFELIAVVTTKENGTKWWPGVAGVCSENKIPLYQYEESFIEKFHYINIDWCFLLSWKYLFPKELIQRIAGRVVNLHYSLLPAYRGVYPVNWAIIEGKKYTGVTYHLIGEKIDTGQLVCQKSLPIYLTDTARTLQLRLDDLAYDLFDQVLDLTIGGSLNKLKPAFIDGYQETYKSYNDFIESNRLELTCEFKVIDLLNLLRGKTFFPDSNNAYIVDPDTGKKIYITIQLHESQAD